MINMADLYMGDDPEIIAYLREKFGAPQNDRCGCGKDARVSCYNPDGQELHMCYGCYLRMDVPIEGEAS